MLFGGPCIKKPKTAAAKKIEMEGKSKGKSKKTMETYMKNKIKNFTTIFCFIFFHLLMIHSVTPVTQFVANVAFQLYCTTCTYRVSNMMYFTRKSGEKGKCFKRA